MKGKVAKLNLERKWEWERRVLTPRGMLPEPFRSGYRLVLALVVEVPRAVEGRERLRWNLLA
jgi:hypothetical protein